MSARRRGGPRAARLVILAAALTGAARGAPAQAPVFGPDTALVVTIRTDLRALRRDRDTLTAPWREATLSYAGDSGLVTIPLMVRTRGQYRLRTCDFPPVRLRFADSAVHGTALRGLRRPKLANPCRDDGDFEQYLLEEYAIYRVFRLFTPVGLSARLLRVTWEDSAGRTRPIKRYSFLTEEPERLAARLDATLLTEVGAPIGVVSRPYAALLGIFEYFIGNTDWSALGRHNILLFRTRDTVFTVPYDFDWSGVIETPYARPAPVLGTRSVRERVFRGFCQAGTDFDPVLDRFEALRDSIAALYRAIPGLSRRSVERTLGYYGDFYREIRDRPRFRREVLEKACRE